jgi:hypothetical protein
MMRLTVSLICAALAIATPVASQERQTIGIGRLFNNDLVGDGHDRWRTGSYVFSLLRAPEFYDGTAQPFGNLLEYRLRAEIIAPDRSSAAPGDRPYAGALSFGVHSHFGLGAADVSLGADLTALGPQTGLSSFQEAYHNTFSLPDPPYTEDQLGNALHLGGTAEVRTAVKVNDNLTLLPFAEARAGTEDLVRIGGDVVFGQIAQGDLMLRDVVTGQLYRGTTSAGSGFALVAGGDFAAVSDSIYLPKDKGYSVVEAQIRARAGMHYQFTEDVTVFYGLTYLGEEFEGQTDGQVLGSLKLNFNF